MEQFKLIEEWPAYRISNYGRIQSRWQRGKAYYNGFVCEDIWRDLPTHNGGRGYLKVSLCDGRGKVKSIKIHVLVAQYFLGPKSNNAQVIRHLDGNKLNNCASNLSYGTYKDNEDDKIAHGTWNTRNGGAKLTKGQVLEIRNKILIGKTDTSLANEYNVSRPTITRIRNYKIWK